MPNNIVYQISNNRLWDVEYASFVSDAAQGKEIIQLYNNGVEAGVDYLARTLRFYGYPLGELMTDEEKLIEAKAKRADAVSRITVTVDGMTFDGDEVSQERMARTITAAVATGEDMSATTTWVLADNTIAQPSIQQLAQALRQAGEQQTVLWTAPYEGQPAEEPTTHTEDSVSAEATT